MNFELGFAGGNCSRFLSLQLSAAVARISVRRAKGFSRTACDVLFEVEVSTGIPIASESPSLSRSFLCTRSGYDLRTVFWARILSDKLVCCTRGVSEPRSLEALLCFSPCGNFRQCSLFAEKSTTESGVLVKLVSPHLERETLRTSSVWTAKGCSDLRSAALLSLALFVTRGTILEPHALDFVASEFPLNR